MKRDEYRSQYLLSKDEPTSGQKVPSVKEKKANEIRQNTSLIFRAHGTDQKHEALIPTARLYSRQVETTNVKSFLII